jgi:hypothetical protein
VIADREKNWTTKNRKVIDLCRDKKCEREWVMYDRIKKKNEQLGSLFENKS